MLYTPPNEAEEKLEALVKRRSRPVDIRAAEKNRLNQIHESQRQSVADLIAHLDDLIAALDKDIDKHTDTFQRQPETPSRPPHIAPKQKTVPSNPHGFSCARPFQAETFAKP